jgi:probable phosphoglycerate mutase
MPLQAICLVRHGETEWALSGRHTGRTDIHLTAKGEDDARSLPARLAGVSFSHVFTSPLQRAARTAELAGFGQAERAPELLEWHYGQYEGLKSVEIRQNAPGWRLFRDGCPGGESPAEIAARVDGFLAKLKSLDGNALLFAHGHVLRTLAARFLEEEVALGERLFLGTASVSILGFEHPPHDPCVRLWNDRHHVNG